MSQPSFIPAGTGRPGASVVIPAHNESAVIGDTLRTLLAEAEPGEFEVVVACNGCTDDTAVRARAAAPEARVLEGGEASKIAALNAGDAAATRFPRVYLDADVTLTTAALRATVAVLNRPDALAASPAMDVDTAGSVWPVRAFYRVWLRRGFHQGQPLGGGVYAVSAEGRRRFGSFPEIIADDEFVRRHFRRDERHAVPGHHFTIRAPRTVRDLVKVKTRSRLGRYELRQRFPELFSLRESQSDHASPWWPPTRWPEQAAYTLIATATVVRARRQLVGLAHYRWERDETSRRPTPR